MDDSSYQDYYNKYKNLSYDNKKRVFDALVNNFKSTQPYLFKKFGSDDIHTPISFEGALLIILKYYDQNLVSEIKKIIDRIGNPSSYLERRSMGLRNYGGRRSSRRRRRNISKRR